MEDVIEEVDMDAVDILDGSDVEHYGVKRRSGRYPWGSGEDPYQHSGDFLARVAELKKSGMNEKELAEALGYENTTYYRRAYRMATNQRKRIQTERAKSLAEDGLGATEIGRQLGVSESTVRSWLDESRQSNLKIATNIADTLKQEIDSKGAIDIGAGVERELGISRNKLDEAMDLLEAQGYNVMGVGVPQASNSRQRTIVQVIAKPEVTQKDLYDDPSKIRSFQDYHSEDGGVSWRHREYPASIDSKRVAVRYAEDGGLGKDGVMEIRPGVKDLDLGNSHYAQVRILVDGTHYLKGMAMYSDDLPEGVDVMFNTNKKRGTPMIDKEGDGGVLKKIKDDKDNPFGAYIKADGQSFYDDPNGKYTNPKTGKKQSLSAINKLKEEGDWEEMSRSLSSQFLSKQPMSLIKKQLDLTYSDYADRFDEIKSIPNPTVRKKMLQEFADECDSAVTHLKAAALPRQQTRVILPVPGLKETEVYAPYLKDGEHVVLVRFPHGGTFEIPSLTVNNKNPSAKKALGNPIDAIGINAKVAEQLSGADFDGDTALVIPTNSRVRISTSKPLKELENFDPKTAYAIPEGNPNNRPIMTKANTQKQMGVVSNLITDMTLKGAPIEDIAKAVRHSMVVIDANKHHLDYKQSEIDNDIPALKKKWQTTYDEDGNVVKSGGASTLLSKRKQTVRVDETRGSGKIDPETGQLYYETTGRTYVNAKGERVKAKKEVPLLTSVQDLHELSSGTPQEEAYADYGNRLRDLANQVRLEYLNTPRLAYSPSANKTYAAEVSSLKAKINVAALNAPRERRAQALARSIINAKKQENPELNDKSKKKELAKVESYAIDEARAAVGARTQRINVTQREWEAIQAGAVSDNTLTQILRYADEDQIRELAMPRQRTTLSDARQSRLRNMYNSGYTIAQIAESLGVSTSTVSKYLKSETN